jgi:hypothetical protein
MMIIYIVFTMSVVINQSIIVYIRIFTKNFLLNVILSEKKQNKNGFTIFFILKVAQYELKMTLFVFICFFLHLMQASLQEFSVNPQNK